MFKQVIDFLNHKDWAFTEIKGKTIAIFGISGKNGKFQCIVDVREEEKRIIFLTVCGANATENKKIEICELLTRLNFGKFLGNFEMDYEDGEIRYKTSMYWGNSELEKDVLDKLIMTNITTMDTSLPSIMGLIYSDMTPSDAYNIVGVEQLTEG